MDIVFQTSNPALDVYKPGLEKALRLMVDTYSGTLALRNLRMIIVADDFAQSIEDFEEQHGLRKNGFTNDAIFGRAFAKVMSCGPSLGAPDRAIIIDAVLALSLFSSEGQDFAINAFHRELCHVHDEGIKARVFAVDSRSGPATDLKHMLQISADTVWSEYVAYRLSAATIPDGSDLFVPSFIEVLPKARSQP